MDILVYIVYKYPSFRVEYLFMAQVERQQKKIKFGASLVNANTSIHIAALPLSLFCMKRTILNFSLRKDTE